MRRLLLILLSLNSILSFNLFSIIYPIKNTFNKLNKDWNFKNKLFPSNILLLSPLTLYFSYHHRPPPCIQYILFCPCWG